MTDETQGEIKTKPVAAVTVVGNAHEMHLLGWQKRPAPCLCRVRIVDRKFVIKIAIAIKIANVESRRQGIGALKIHQKTEECDGKANRLHVPLGARVGAPVMAACGHA
jgi:hypothetical protein